MRPVSRTSGKRSGSPTTGGGGGRSPPPKGGDTLLPSLLLDGGGLHQDTTTWRRNIHTTTGVDMAPDTTPFRAGAVVKKKKKKKEDPPRPLPLPLPLPLPSAVCTDAYRSLRHKCDAFLSSLQLEHIQKVVAAATTSIQPPSSPLLFKKQDTIKDRALDAVCSFLSTASLCRVVSLTCVAWRQAARRVSGERITLLRKAEGLGITHREFSDGYKVVRYADGTAWEGAYDDVRSHRYGPGTLTFSISSGISNMCPGIPRAISLDGAHSVRGTWASDCFVTGSVLFRNGDVMRLHGQTAEYCYHEGGTVSGYITPNGTWKRCAPCPSTTTNIPSLAIFHAGGTVPVAFLRNVPSKALLESLRSAIDSACPGLHPTWVFSVDKASTVDKALPRNRAQMFHSCHPIGSRSSQKKYHNASWARRRCGWHASVAIHNDTVYALAIQTPVRCSTPPSDASQSSTVIVTTPTRPVSVVRVLKKKAAASAETISLLPCDMVTDACREGNAAGLHALLSKHGSHLASQPNHSGGRTPLHTACEHGHRDVVEALSGLSIPLSPEDCNGHTPLHAAAKNGHATVIACLLQHQEAWNRINAQDLMGRTALHMALERKFVNTALWLVEQGADVNLKDAQGRTPCTMARTLLPDVADLKVADLRCLLKCLPSRTIFKSVAKIAHTHREDVEQHTMEEKLLSYVVLEKYDTPVDQSLMYAAYLRLKVTNGSIAFGLQNSMGVNGGSLCLNVTRTSVLHETASKGDLKAVGLLLQCPLVDINAPNANRQTPLHRAAARGHVSMVCLLLYDSRCAAHTQDSLGRTALHLAVQSRCYNGAAMILHRMTLLEAQLCDANGYTALQYACAGKPTPASISLCCDVFLKVKSLEYQSPAAFVGGVKQTPMQRRVAARRKTEAVVVPDVRTPRAVVYTVHSTGGNVPALRFVFSDICADQTATTIISYRGLSLLAYTKGTSVSGFSTAMNFKRPSPSPWDPETNLPLPNPNFADAIATCAAAGNHVVLGHLLQRNRGVVGPSVVATTQSLPCLTLLLQHPFTEVPTSVDGIPLCIVLLKKGYTVEWLRHGLPYHDPSCHTDVNPFSELISLAETTSSTASLWPSRARKPLNRSHKIYMRERSHGLLAVMDAMIKFWRYELLSSSISPLRKMAAEALLPTIGTPFFTPLYECVRKSNYFVELKLSVFQGMPRNWADTSRLEQDVIRLLDTVILTDAAASVHSLCSKRYFQAALAVVKRAQEDNTLNFRRVGKEDGMTSLHYAARYGKTELCYALLGTGNFPLQEKTVREGLSALHLAALGGHHATVSAFLKMGNIGAADDDIASSDAAGARYSPGYHRNVPRALPRSTTEGLTPLHFACLAGSVDTVRVLLLAGSNAQRRDRVHNTPLHVACYKGHRGIAMQLLDAGAQLETPNCGGDSALLLAARTGHEGLVNMLITRKDSKNANNKHLLVCRNGVTGHTLGHYAALHGHLTLLEQIGVYEKANSNKPPTSQQPAAAAAVAAVAVDTTPVTIPQTHEPSSLLASLALSAQALTGVDTYRSRFTRLGQILEMPDQKKLPDKIEEKEASFEASYRSTQPLISCGGTLLPGLGLLADALNSISPGSVVRKGGRETVEEKVDVLGPLANVFAAAAQRLIANRDAEGFPHLHSLCAVTLRLTPTPMATATLSLGGSTLPPGGGGGLQSPLVGYPYTPIHYAMANGRAEAVEAIRKFTNNAVTDFAFDDEHPPPQPIVDVPPLPKVAAPPRHMPSAELRRKATVATDALKPFLPAAAPPPVEWVHGYYREVMKSVRNNPYPPSSDWNTIMQHLRATYLCKLLWACRHGHLPYVATSFTLLADPLITTPSNVTPLMIATWFGHIDVVSLLMGRGALVEQGTRLQQTTAGALTALHIACMRNDAPLVSLLLAKGSSNIVDARDECGNTALHLACSRNSFALTKMLLCGDANIFSKNNVMDTAEMICVHQRNADCTRLLYWWTLASRFTSSEAQLEEQRELAKLSPPAAHGYVTAWFGDSNAYHARLDHLQGEYLPLPHSDPEESIPCLLYHKICRVGGDVPARSVLQQLVFHRWPEQVREVDMGGTYIGSKGIRNILQLLTVLPNVEAVDLSGNRLENSSIIELCEYARVHPGLRRLILNNNKGIGRAGGVCILKLLRANQRILYVDVGATQVDFPLQEKIRWQTEENKRFLASKYATEATEAFWNYSSNAGSNNNRSRTPGTMMRKDPRVKGTTGAADRPATSMR